MHDEHVAFSGAVLQEMAGPWSELSLSRASETFLTEKLQFAEMAPVQACTIPQMIRGMDVVVQAMTGSGKTLAYAVPIFESLMKKQQTHNSTHDIHSIVIIPTRELGLQIVEVFHTYRNWINEALGSDVRTMRMMGGYDLTHDLQHYQKFGCHILIATPGRLFEVLCTSSSPTLHVQNLSLCVLDEADQLLALGFQTHLNIILKRLPSQRQTALFSATQSKELTELSRCGLRRPLTIDVRDTTSATAPSPPHGTLCSQLPPQLKLHYSVMRYHRRLEAVVCFLSNKNKKLMEKTEDDRMSSSVCSSCSSSSSDDSHARYQTHKILIYVLTCASVDWLFAALHVLLPDATLFALHGQLPTSKRVKAREGFMNASQGVLICTDVAARGLDIPFVDAVVQLDAPTNPRSFVHRIGRTARMGRAGQSITFLDPTELEYLPYLQLQGITLDAMEILKGVETENETKPDPRFLLGSAVMKKGDRNRARKKSTEQGSSPTVSSSCYNVETVNIIRRAYLSDRTIMNLATRAFACFVRGYKEHHCRYIFRFESLNIADLTNGYGLFQVPNLSETRMMSRIQIGLPDEFSGIDIHGVSCADPVEEEKRIQKLEARKKKLDIKRSERNERREVLKKSTDLSKHKKKQIWKQIEVSEIFHEGALLRKLKGKKITEEEYRRRTGEDVFVDAPSHRERKKLRLLRGSQNLSLCAERSPGACLSEEDMDHIDTTPCTMQGKKRRRKSKKR